MYNMDSIRTESFRPKCPYCPISNMRPKFTSGMFTKNMPIWKCTRCDFKFKSSIALAHVSFPQPKEWEYEDGLKTTLAEGEHQ